MRLLDVKDLSEENVDRKCFLLDGFQMKVERE